MKLKEFNENTLPKQWGKAEQRPKISFAKSGNISFNRAATRLMGVVPGSKIAIGQDEDAPENWYVYESPKGYQLRGKSDWEKNGALCFSHQLLRKDFYKANEFTDSDNEIIDETKTFTLCNEPIKVKGDKTIYFLIQIAH